MCLPVDAGLALPEPYQAACAPVGEYTPYDDIEFAITGSRGAASRLHAATLFEHLAQIFDVRVKTMIMRRLFSSGSKDERVRKIAPATPEIQQYVRAQALEYYGGIKVF